MNHLLQRQLQKHAPHLGAEAGVGEFLAAVSAYYDEMQQERRQIEQALAATSDELTSAHDRIRREADSQIAALNRRYRQTLESQQGLIASLRKTARGFVIQLCHGELARRLGLDAEQVEDRTVAEIVPPANVPALTAAFERAWAGKKASFAYTDERTGIRLFCEMRPRSEAGEVCEIIWSAFDVTPLARAEDALQRLNIDLERRVRARTRELALSEGLYRNLVENINQGYYIANRRSIFCYANPAVSAVSGYSREELLQLSAFRLVAEEDRARVVAAYRALEAGEVPELTIQFRMATKTGRTFWVEQNTFPVRDAVGQLLEFRNTVRDITDRVVAEDKLRSSEQRYAELLENINDALIRDDHEGRLVYVNRHFREWFGLDDRAVGDIRLEDHVAPEWCARLRDRRERLQRGENVPDRFEYEGVLVDGGRRWLEAFVTRIVDGGRLVGTQSVIRDITVRKESEAARDRLLALTQATLESTADSIVAVDADEGVQTFNRVFVEMWRIPEDVLAGRDARRVLDHLASQLAEPEKFLARECGLRAAPLAESFDTLHFKDDRVFECHTRPQFVNGAPAGRVWSFRDITARRRAEQQREKLEASLRQSQKMESLGTLAGGIAHDFNNILTGIVSFIELAGNELPPSHPARVWLEHLAAPTKRATDLVRQILTFSRKSETQRVPQRLQPIVTDALRLLRSTLPPMVELVPTIDAATPRVLADATQIHQVILNLCTNAWHALPARGGRIILLLEPVEVTPALAARLDGLAPGPHAYLAIADNGAGMDAATLERIFEPFFTTKDPGKGTGLGLAVVHGIVKSHGGAVTVQSRLGQGAKFEIYFPALAMPTARSAPPIPENIPRGRGEHVIVVDDDPLSGFAIEKTVQSFGYRVTRFTEPRDVLAHLRRNPAVVDLIVSDVAMPGMTGDALAAELMTLRADLPVLLLTGFIDPARQAALERCGARAVLAKPPDRATFARLIAQHLQKAV